MKRTLYIVTYPDGTHVTGTAPQLVGTLTLSSSYIRRIAASGQTTRNGIRVGVAEPGDMTVHTVKKKYYVATNPCEDPIVGDAEEIAALTGISAGYVRHIALKNKTCRGWSVREATEKEWEDFNEAF